MFRPQLGVTLLEDRTTPAFFSISINIGVTESLNGVVPPSDPMDDPPPVQPGTGGTGSTTPPVSPPPSPPPTTPPFNRPGW